MEFIKETAKAVAGFVVGVVMYIVGRLATGEDTIPTDLKGWGLLALAGIVGYLGVYVPANKRNPQQVAKDLSKLPTVQQERVVEAFSVPAASNDYPLPPADGPTHDPKRRPVL